MTTYYVSQSDGSNGDSGLTPELAWQTLARVNATALNGDTILFKRGDTWRERLYLTNGNHSGTAEAPTIFGAYGNGAKPIFQPSLDLSATTAWADQGSNIWRAGAAYGSVPVAVIYDIGNMIFNAEVSFGTKLNPTTAPTAQGAFRSHFTGSGNTCDYVEMYSVGNPGEVYTHIEAAMAIQGILNLASHLRFSNIMVQYSGWQGIHLDDGTHDIIVDGVDERYIGGGSTSTYERDGNGLQTWGAISDITIRYCTFDQCFEAGFGLQSNLASKAVNNIKMYGNIVSHSGMGYEHWLIGTGDTYSNIYLCHNIFYNMGGCAFGSNYSAWRGIKLYAQNSATASNVVVKNNIFHTPHDSYWLVYDGTVLTEWDINYNCYYQADDAARWTFTTPATYTFAEWKAATGKDTNSINVDPKFVTLGSDYHAQSDSPCINTGVADGLGLPYLGAGPDMGPYEYDAQGPLKRCPFRKP